MQKNQIISLINRMPDEIKIGDLIAELQFREKLEKGLRQIDEGKVVSHEQAKQRLSKWLD